MLAHTSIGTQIGAKRLMVPVDAEVVELPLPKASRIQIKTANGQEASPQ